MKDESVIEEAFKAKGLGRPKSFSSEVKRFSENQPPGIWQKREVEREQEERSERIMNQYLEMTQSQGRNDTETTTNGGENRRPEG